MSARPLAEFEASAIEASSSSAQALADEVLHRGAATVRRAIPQALVAQARLTLIEAEKDDKRTYGDSYPYQGMVHALMTRSPVFMRLLELPVVLCASRAILGHGCIVSAFNSSSLPPRTGNYTSRIHVDSPRLIPGYLTNLGFIFALDPFTRSNGAMEIAPALADQATCPTEAQFDAAKVVLDHLMPGDAVCFNVRCWHRGGTNQTDTTRHAVTLNVCRNYMRQQFDYPRMLGREATAAMSADLQQFLGCFVQMPVSMDEFMLPPEQRPYRPGQE